MKKNSSYKKNVLSVKKIFTFAQTKKKTFMKNLKKDQNKKLFLNKKTITILNKEQQNKLVGGEPTGTTATGTTSLIDWILTKK